MKIKVWFNHWFSTAYHIIELMKKGCGHDICVIGSNRNPDSPVQLACDEWYTEPAVMSDEDYLEYCLDFCREHEIDVFVPRRGMCIIGKNSSRFAEIGVKLLTDTENEAVEIFADKVKAYEYLSDIVPEVIPEYYGVTSPEEFRTAYEKITHSHERACFKFAADEGAASFRVIDNSINGKNALTIAPGLKLTYENAERIMSDYDFHHTVLMMPYLKDVEISADCLSLPSGNIIIPRFKSNGRIYTVKYDAEIIDICEKILKKSGLKMPCNIQFKCDNGKPYLLEINTRMSGGVQLSCIAAEVNIPALAFKALMGEDTAFTVNKTERKVSYIEEPLLIPN